MARTGRILAWTGGTIVGLLVVTAIALLLLPWDWARGPLDRRLSDASGRGIAIHGPLHVHLGLTTRVEAQDVEVNNTPWGSEPKMLRIKDLFVSIYLPDLLRGRTVIPELRLVQPNVLLEKNEKGDTNWHFANPKAKAVKSVAVPQNRTEVPIIDHLLIEQGRLAYKDPTKGINLDSHISTATGGDPAHQHVTLEGTGNFHGDPFRLLIDGGSILALRDETRPYPLRVEASIGQTKGAVDGTVTDPLQLTGIDLKMHVSGNDLADIYPIFGIPSPQTPPYSLEGRLTRHEDTWSFQDFSGHVGHSDLSGTASVDTGGSRPRMRAVLTSKNIDIKDLSGFIGKPPSQPETNPNRVLPDKPVNLARLRSMDMDVHFNGRHVEAFNLPVRNLNGALKVDNGQATLDPLSFDIANGKIEGSVMLDGRQDVPSAKLDLGVHQVDLADLVPDRFQKEMSGTLGGRFNLAGTGKSTAEILGHSDGRIDLFMGQGRFSNLILDLIGLDVGEVLTFLATKDKPVEIRCMVTDFSVNQGLMTSDTMVLDTTDSAVTGEGTINLRDETLDLRLVSHPKSPSIFSARAPLLVHGTLKKPSVGVDVAAVGARTGAAAALGVLLTPLGALLPFIELGLGKNSPCHQLIENAKAGTQQAGAPGR